MLKTLFRRFRPAGLRLFIAQRQSPDWGSLSYDYFAETRAFERLIGRPEGVIERYIRLWDETFEVSYFQTRHRLKAISQANFAAVRGAELIEAADAAAVTDPDAILLFTDDDDWYHPDIAAHLAEGIPADCDLVLWASLVLRGAVERRQPEMFCFTNNYGARATLVARHRDDVNAVAQHWTADGLVKSGGCRPVLLPRYLSMVNRHPASTVVLEKALAEEGSSDRLVRLVADFSHPAAVVAEAAWATSEIEAVKALFREVGESARHFDRGPSPLPPLRGGPLPSPGAGEGV